MTKVINVEGWPVVVGSDDVSRTRGTDLAMRLGFRHPVDVRKIIRRNLSRDAVFATVEKNSVRRQTRDGLPPDRGAGVEGDRCTSEGAG